MPAEAVATQSEDQVYERGVDSTKIYEDDIEGRLAQAQTDYEVERAKKAREHLDHALGRASVGGAEGSGIRLINDKEYERARQLSHVANRTHMNDQPRG